MKSYKQFSQELEKLLAQSPMSVTEGIYLVIYCIADEVNNEDIKNRYWKEVFKEYVQPCTDLLKEVDTKGFLAELYMDFNKQTKRGEFYTPQCLVDFIYTWKPLEDKRIFDIACGAGSLIGNYNLTNDVVGFELSQTACDICTLGSLTVKNVNSLDINPADYDPFDYFIINPPFGLKGVKDYEFVEKSISMLKKGGGGIAILPLGISFRDDCKAFRTKYLKLKHIKTIIELPANMFPNTNVGVVLYEFDFSREYESILMINAKDEFKKVGNKNVFTPDRTLFSLAQQLINEIQEEIKSKRLNEPLKQAG